MQQLSEAYDESSGIKRDDNASSTQSKNGYRQLLWGGGGYRETLSVSPQVYGGGYSAYWRMTDIWREQNKNKPVPNAEVSTSLIFLCCIELLISIWTLDSLSTR